MKNLKKKYDGWALITGASSGIGKEFARHLAGQGFDLILVARNQTALDTLAQELSSQHKVNTRVVVADLSEQGASQKVFDATQDLDVGLLVPSAGIDEMGLFLEKEYSSLEKMMRLNIEAPTHLAHLYGRKMTARARSGIIFVSSLFAYQGIPHFATYAATKAYILTLGEALTVELKSTGVDVLTLSPGLTATPFADSLKMNKALVPMFAEKPAKVARVGINHVGRKATIVSGFLNKFYAWENRLIPRSWPVKLFGFLIGNAARSYQKKQGKN
jgi:short-subunit dehydrogenase